MLLDSFTTTEKVVIARAHPVVTILKLKPNNKFNPGSYKDVQGYSVLLWQNLGLLFNLLSSETTSIDEVIQVVLASKTFPQLEQWSQFMTAQRHYIIDALHWLRVNNPLYGAMKINYHLLDIWDDEFISSSITNNVANYNFKYYKRWGYVADLCKNNNENDSHAAIADTKIEGDHIHSGCIYKNIDDGRQNPILRLLSAINNIKVTDLTLDTTSSLIISYHNKGQLL